MDSLMQFGLWLLAGVTLLLLVSRRRKRKALR
jgi:LPXTG-motif cell wall-anchored protein